jgi:hypothetical protein
MGPVAVRCDATHDTQRRATVGVARRGRGGCKRKCYGNVEYFRAGCCKGLLPARPNARHSIITGKGQCSFAFGFWLPKNQKGPEGGRTSAQPRTARSARKHGLGQSRAEIPNCFIYHRSFVGGVFSFIFISALEVRKKIGRSRLQTPYRVGFRPVVSEENLPLQAPSSPPRA